MIALAFRDYFGLTKGEATFLEALYAARGKPVYPANPRVARVRVSCIRSAMEPESIDTITRGRGGRAGYCLTESGMAECRSAIRISGEALSRAVARAEASH